MFITVDQIRAMVRVIEEGEGGKLAGRSFALSGMCWVESDNERAGEGATLDFSIYNGVGNVGEHVRIDPGGEVREAGVYR